MLLANAAAGLVGQTAAFAYQSLRAIRDPTDGEAVSAVGELSSLDALEGIKYTMMGDLNGRAILLHQPRITDDTLTFARAQEEGTFGSRYAAYMDYNGFTPSGRTAVRHISDPSLAYVMTRYRECHDFLHTIADAGRSVEEELAVKLLEWRHTGLPLGLLAVAGGSPHLQGEQRQRLATYWKWAADNAPTHTHGDRYVPCYLNVMWENLLSRPLAEVRAVTGIVPLPEYLMNRGILTRSPRERSS